nr:GreA/GreB family elongation factor [Pseudomonadota bacterium]
GSWAASPVARARLGRARGDAIEVKGPKGRRELEVLEIRFDPI